MPTGKSSQSPRRLDHLKRPKPQSATADTTTAPSVQFKCGHVRNSEYFSSRDCPQCKSDKEQAVHKRNRELKEEKRLLKQARRALQLPDCSIKAQYDPVKSIWFARIWIGTTDYHTVAATLNGTLASAIELFSKEKENSNESA